MTKKSIKIDVNKFIIKYDFDVAARICPIKSGLVYNDDYQKIYKQNALMEVLQECSSQLTKGQKNFQCMYTFDGQVIKDLSQIPLDCQLLLVSE